jgi:hypothetical protein
VLVDHRATRPGVVSCKHDLTPVRVEFPKKDIREVHCFIKNSRTDNQVNQVAP